MIWGARKGKYFCKWDWTGGIRLIRFNKFGRARTQRSRMERRAIRDRDAADHISLVRRTGLLEIQSVIPGRANGSALCAAR